MSNIYTLVKSGEMKDKFKALKIFTSQDYNKILKNNGLIFTSPEVALYTAKVLASKGFSYSETTLTLSYKATVQFGVTKTTKDKLSLVCTSNVPSWETVAQYNDLPMFKKDDRATLKAESHFEKIANLLDNQSGIIKTVTKMDNETFSQRLGDNWEATTIKCSVRPEQYIIEFDSKKLDLLWLPTTTFNLKKEAA